MVRAGGSQCGYCTPGFVVSLFCEYYRPGRDGFDPESISGNLCRCTGYRPIADVARTLPAPAAGDPRLAELAAPVPPRTPRRQRATASSGSSGRPASTICSAASGRRPTATLIAGGTDVMVGVTQKGDRHPVVISLAALPELRAFAVTPDAIVLGAGLTLTEVEEHLHAAPEAAVPLLAQLLPLFSSRLIRNRATLGGNLMTASPIGDAPAGAARARRVGDAGERGRAPRRAAARVLPRLPQDRGAAGRSDDRRARAAGRAGDPALLQGEQAHPRRHLDRRGRVRARPDAGRTRGAGADRLRRHRRDADPRDRARGRRWPASRGRRRRRRRCGRSPTASARR